MRILTIITFLVAGQLVKAGQEVGNGGYSVVCRDKNMKITEAHILDLFEAENIGLTIRYTKDEVEVQLKNLIDKLDENSGVGFEISKQLKLVKQKAKFIKKKTVGMPLTSDAFPKLKQKGCEYEQLATYYTNNDENFLLIDSEIYDAISKTDRAALWMHEVLYKMNREFNNATDSLKTRELVGHLVSDQDIETIRKKFDRSFWELVIDQKSILWLHASRPTIFKIYSNVPEGTQCNFELIGYGITLNKEVTEVVINEYNPDLNGHYFRRLIAQCPNTKAIIESKEKFYFRIEVIQDGLALVSWDFKELDQNTMSISSETAEVKFPNDENIYKSLTLRFLL